MSIVRAISGAALGLAVSLASSHAFGQEVRFGAGATLPLEPEAFTDLYDFGFHGGAELTATVNKPKTTHLGLALYHHRFPLDEDEAFADAGGADLEASGGTWAITEVLGVGRFDMSAGNTRPYIVVGLGFAHQTATDLSVTVAGQKRTTEFDGETDTMVTLGLGVTHSLGDVSLFGQIRLANVMSDDESTVFVPLTLGVEL